MEYESSWLDIVVEGIVNTLALFTLSIVFGVGLGIGVKAFLWVVGW